MPFATYVDATRSIVRDVTYLCSSSMPTRHMWKFVLVIKTSNGLLVLCATIVRKCFETGSKENPKVCRLEFQWFGANPRTQRVLERKKLYNITYPNIPPAIWHVLHSGEVAVPVFKDLPSLGDKKYWTWYKWARQLWQWIVRKVFFRHWNFPRPQDSSPGLTE